MSRAHSHHPTAAQERKTTGVYSRQEVLRLLRIEGRQLKSWERNELIPELDEYRFSDLLALKTVIRLRAEKVPLRRIRQALLGLRQQLRVSPGEDVRVYKDGRHVRVQIGKHKMEPVSGQLVFDFDEHEITKLLHLPISGRGADRVAQTLKNKIEADRWFERGLELEQTGAPYEQIIKAYERATELDPRAAGALVNLGTVFFNGHAWSDAEKYYKKALEIDSNYPLAYFNLGNLYDERGDIANALENYRAALKIFPNYADVHYNLALLHQSAGEVMDAVRHWKAYLKLDGSSTWGQIARRELGKLEAVTLVHGSRSLSTRSRAGENRGTETSD